MPGTPESRTSTPPGTLGRLAELGWQALPAIASAIGVVGFVSLVGGAIEWIRFEAAGLPADQATRVVPKAELVTVGAGALITYTLAGLGAVLLVYLLDREGDLTSRTARGLVSLAAVEMAVAVVYQHDDKLFYPAVAGWLIALVLLASFPLRRLPRRLRRGRLREHSVHELRASRRALEVATLRLADARRCERKSLPVRRRASPNAEVAGATQEHCRAERRWRRAVTDACLEKAPPTKWIWRPPGELALEDWLATAGPRPHRPALSTVALALLFAGGAVGLALRAQSRWLAVMLAVIVVLALANFGVARATAKFAWYGVAVLLSVVMFGAALSISRTQRTPKVQPVALIRKSDDRVLCGVYITETDKRVYIGRVEPEGDHALVETGRIFWVPSADVDVVSVGPLQIITHAENRAKRLREELLADRAEIAGEQPKPPAKAPSAAPPSVPRSGLARQQPQTDCATAKL